jgi:hypothetical protein
MYDHNNARIVLNADCNISRRYNHTDGRYITELNIKSDVRDNDRHNPSITVQATDRDMARLMHRMGLRTIVFYIDDDLTFTTAYDYIWTGIEEELRKFKKGTKGKKTVYTVMFSNTYCEMVADTFKVEI